MVSFTPMGRKKKFIHGIVYKPLAGECWIPVKGYFGLYEISNLGRLKSLPRKGSPRTTIMQVSKDTSGYPVTALTKNKKSKTFKIHTLVANAFHKLCSGCPDVNHIDGDKTNNKATNLERCSRSYNLKHSFAIGLKSQHADKHHGRKVNSRQVKEIVKKYLPRVYTRKMLAEEYGISEAAIKKILNKTNWASIW